MLAHLVAAWRLQLFNFTAPLCDPEGREAAALPPSTERRAKVAVTTDPQNASQRVLIQCSQMASDRRGA
jgi:hypothetical protein